MRTLPRIAIFFTASMAILGALTVADRILQMDQNSDGKVTQAEWKGPAEGFARIDRNQDGLIDAEELVPLRELIWTPGEGRGPEGGTSNRIQQIRTNVQVTVTTNGGVITTNRVVSIRTNIQWVHGGGRPPLIQTNWIVSVSSNLTTTMTTNSNGAVTPVVGYAVSTNRTMRVVTNLPPKPQVWTVTTNRSLEVTSNAVVATVTNGAGSVTTRTLWQTVTNERVRLVTNFNPPFQGAPVAGPIITTNLMRTVTSNLVVVAASNGLAARSNWVMVTNNRFFVTTNLAGLPTLTTNVSSWTVTNRVAVILSNTNGMKVFTNWVTTLVTNTRVSISTNWGRGDRAPNVLRIPEGVEVQRDVNYRGSTNAAQFLDWARPIDRDGLLPAIIYIPGGQWAKADRANALARVVHWATNGFFVAVVGFRQSQQAKWPAQMVDLKTAVRYIRAKAPQLGVHPDRIAVWGTSSGGHLASMLGATGEVSNFDAKDWGAVSSKVQAVVNWSGPSDLNRIYEGPSTVNHLDVNAPESRLLGSTITNRPDLASNASPVNWVSAKAPPFLIIHSSSDTLVPAQQALLLEEALKKVGVPVELHLVGGDAHAQFRTREPEEWTLQFLKRTLVPKE